MLRTRLAALALAAALPLAGCASAPLLPENDRLALDREWENKVLYLRASLNVTPFFSDASKRLASPLHADSILLLVDTKGAPISPGEVESVVPMGTKVRIEKIEHPTGLTVTRRPLYTPRNNPWVWLALPGVARGRPYIVVLRHGMLTREDFRAALGDLFSEDEPSIWLKGATPEERQAVEEKRLVAGMGADLVVLSWGRPEKIQQDLDGGVKVETWTWPLGKRSATFRDGKLTAAVPELARPAN